MTDRRMLAAIRRRRARVAAMGKILLEAYEPASWRERVSSVEVVEYMARRLGRSHHGNPHFSRQVFAWARALGWRRVRPQGKSWLRGVRPRQKAVSG